MLPLTELAGVDPLLTFEGEGDSSAGFVFLFDAMLPRGTINKNGEEKVAVPLSLKRSQLLLLWTGEWTSRV